MSTNNLNIEYKSDDQNNTSSFFLQKEMTIHQPLDEFKSQLCKSLDKQYHINISSQEEIYIDIAFIQLLIAMSEKAKKEKIQININIQINEVTKQLLKISDLLYILKQYNNE